MSIDFRTITIGLLLAITYLQTTHLERHGEQLDAIEARLDKAGL